MKMVHTGSHVFKRTLIHTFIIIILSSLFPLCFNSFSLVAEEILDNSGAAFLTIDPFARSAAMGSAFTGTSGGITSLYFNPGGLVLISERDVLSATHCEWFQGMRFENLALSHRLSSKDVLGINVKGFYTGGLEKRTMDTPDREGTFSAYFIDFGLTYSRQLFYFLPVGFSLKGIFESIDNNSTFGACIDMGVVYRTSIDGLEFGFCIKNLGPRMKFREEEFRLPNLFRGGAGYRTLGGNLLLSVDMEKIGERKATVNFGSEVVILKTLSLRAGVNGASQEDIGSTAGLSFGAGFMISNLTVNYAFVNYDYLGMTHRLGLTFSPGITEEERRKIQLLALEEARKSLREKERMMSSMYLEKGEELIEMEKYGEAIDVLDISLVWDSENEKAKELITKTKREMLIKEEYNAFIEGKNLFDMGNYLEAITELDRVIALNPDNMEAVNLKDQAKNKLEEQSLLLAQKDREKSEDIQSLFNSAVEEYSKHNYKLAISKWQKVLVLDPTREDAESYIEKAEKKHNERISSLLNQLNSKTKKKDWLSVVSIAGKIKSFDPANKQAQASEKNAKVEISSLVQLNLNKAKTYYKQGNLFSSEEYFRIVLRYAPKNKEAKAYIQSIEKSKKKEDSDKWYLKGIDAYTKNQFKLAISYWNRCLSIDPNYDKARKNIGRANKKLSELGE